jgi:hypothetical protein
MPHFLFQTLRLTRPLKQFAPVEEYDCQDANVLISFMVTPVIVISLCDSISRITAEQDSPAGSSN